MKVASTVNGSETGAILGPLDCHTVCLAVLQFLYIVNRWPMIIVSFVR